MCVSIVVNVVARGCPYGVTYVRDKWFDWLPKGWIPGARKYPNGDIAIVFVAPWCFGQTGKMPSQIVYQKSKVIEMAKEMKRPHKDAVRLADTLRAEGVDVRTICNPRFLADGTYLGARFGNCAKRLRAKGPRMVMTASGPMEGHMFHLKLESNVSKRRDHLHVKTWTCSRCKLTIDKSDHVRSAMERPCFPSIAGNKARLKRVAMSRRAVAEHNSLLPPKRLSCAGEGTGSRVKRPRTKFAMGETGRPPE